MCTSLSCLLPISRVSSQGPLGWHIPGTKRYIEMARIPRRSCMGVATSEDTPHWQEMLSLGFDPVLEKTALVWN